MPPSKWRIVPFGELVENFDFVRVPVKEADRRVGPFPYYGASGVVDSVDQYLFDGEYLLVAEDGENLRTRTTPVAFVANGKFWVNNHAHIVRGNQHADTRFLQYALANSDIGGFLTGSTMPKLTQGNLNRITVLAPTLPEQRAIARVLGALDDKIELNRRMNETLESMARAIFKSWFIDFDPVRSKLEGRHPAGMDVETAALFPASFVDSPVGRIPANWWCCKWGDIATLEYGKGLRGYSESGGEYRVYGTNGPIGWHTLPLCNRPGIVIGRKGAYRGVHLSRAPFFVIDTAFYLNPKIELDLIWTFHEVSALDINGMDSGSAIPSTSRPDFYGLPVVLPPTLVLREFGKLVQPFCAKMEANSGESVTLASIRDTLLPKLLSGDIRIRDAENQIKAHL